MTPKQEAFVREYLIDMNATQAAIRAGYSEATAYSIGQENLNKPDIADAIKFELGERATRTQINADYVLNRLVEIDQMDVLDIMDDKMNLKAVREWPRVWRQYLSGFDVAEMFEGGGDDRKMVGVLKKIKWPDKVKNLELLGKHVGVQAFKERVEHSGEMAITVLPEDAGL